MTIDFIVRKNGHYELICFGHNFYSMYKIGKKIVDSGHPLRLVGNHTNGMFDHYNRIATLIAKRNKDTKVSFPEVYDHPDKNAKNYSSVTVSKIGKNAGLMAECFRATTLMRNKNNNYGLDYFPNWKSPSNMTAEEAAEEIVRSFDVN